MDSVSATVEVTVAFSYRSRSLLRAVLTGHGELVCGRVPHLLVDGMNVCGSDAAPLIAAGLIAPDLPGQVGMRVLAVLTDAGRNALDRMVAA